MPMSGPGAFGDLEENPGCPFTYQSPMLGESPRSTADTCHSEASAPSLIVSRASSHQD